MQRRKNWACTGIFETLSTWNLCSKSLFSALRDARGCTRGRVCKLFSFLACPAPSPKQLSLPALPGVGQHPPSLPLPAPSSETVEFLAVQHRDVSLLLRLRRSTACIAHQSFLLPLGRLCL